MLGDRTMTVKGTLATADDIRCILGELDDAAILDILALGPAVADVEQAAICLSGDADIFGEGQPLGRIAGDIIAILTADEEQPESRS
jgi:hypothetical protein